MQKSSPNTVIPEKAREPRRLEGVVVSDRMEKTIVVAVTRTRLHPKVKKYFSVTKRFKVHDPENTAHAGDTVTFEETRPISKEKRWKLVGKA